MISNILGLISALSWGSGDFFGGLSSRRFGAFLAVLYAEIAGLVLLILAAPWVNEPLPPTGTLLLASGVGAISCLALVLLYKALSNGKMSIAAPVSGLLGVILPIVVAAFTEGLPGWLKVAGFACAMAAVWLLSMSGGSVGLTRLNIEMLGLPVMAGMGFGLYFVLMNYVTREAIFWPLVFARLGGTLVILPFVLAQRRPLRIPLSGIPLVSMAGLLDVGGNLFYILAGQTGRMDVAVVLSSLYPGATAFFAWLFLKEHISRTQAAGILAALAAIVLMTV